MDLTSVELQKSKSMEDRFGMKRSEDDEGDCPGPSMPTGRPSKELLLLPPPPPAVRWQLILCPEERIGDVDSRQGGGERGEPPAPAGKSCGSSGSINPLMLRRLRFGVPTGTCTSILPVPRPGHSLSLSLNSTQICEAGLATRRAPEFKHEKAARSEFGK